MKQYDRSEQRCSGDLGKWASFGDIVVANLYSLDVMAAGTTRVV